MVAGEGVKHKKAVSNELKTQRKLMVRALALVWEFSLYIHFWHNTSIDLLDTKFSFLTNSLNVPVINLLWQFVRNFYNTNLHDIFHLWTFQILFSDNIVCSKTIKITFQLIDIRSKGKILLNWEARVKWPSASVDYTLLDLQNSSYPTQPHSIIAN